jgi:hypothetical protein
MAKATRLLIKNGTLIDGSGGDPIPNRRLVVDGNWITLVGETGSSMRPETSDDSVFDATGKFWPTRSPTGEVVKVGFGSN